MVRIWLLYFCDLPDKRSTWYLRRGFRHVVAVGFDPSQDRWLIFNPNANGTELACRRPGPEIESLLSGLHEMAGPRVLRFVPDQSNRLLWSLFCRAASLKALLRVRSLAVTPYGLYRALLQHGAEPVEIPSEQEAQDDKAEHAAGAAVGAT